MTYRWRFGMLGLLLLVVSVPLAAGQDAATDLAPYVYYYSDYHQGFVIERADGTDTRLLGEGLGPDDYWVEMNGPGWSENGQWFVWSSVGNIWAMRVDGSRLVSLETITHAKEVVWSPQGS